MSKMIKVLDTDMGIDDAMAIVLIKLLYDKTPDCIIVSAGNASLEDGVSNLLALRKLLELDFVVVKGKDVPLAISDQKETFHGTDGFAGLGQDFIDRMEMTPAELNDYISIDDFMAKLDDFEEIEYTTIGPLSNLAEFIKDYSINKKFTHLFVMGGGLNEYNCEYETEFNFFKNPEAAKIVLSSGKSIILFPLDLTNHQQINREKIKQLAESLMFPEAGPLLEYNYESNLRLNNIPAAVLHDTMPVLYQRFPELFHLVTLNLDIDNNGHIFESENGYPMDIAINVAP